MSTTTRKLRSQEWFQAPEYYAFARRAYLRSEGFNADIFDGKPVIGICNSFSELNHCNVHLRQVAEVLRLTESRISQIRTKALQHLRQSGLVTAGAA